MHLAEVQLAPTSVLRGTVVSPPFVPACDLRPRISIEATVLLMDVLLMLLKSGTIQSAATSAPIAI